MFRSLIDSFLSDNGQINRMFYPIFYLFSNLISLYNQHGSSENAVPANRTNDEVKDYA